MPKSKHGARKSGGPPARGKKSGGIGGGAANSGRTYSPQTYLKRIQTTMQQRNEIDTRLTTQLEQFNSLAKNPNWMTGGTSARA